MSKRAPVLNQGDRVILIKGTYYIHHGLIGKTGTIELCDVISKCRIVVLDNPVPGRARIHLTDANSRKAVQKI